jgi:hypothetical protein
MRRNHGSGHGGSSHFLNTGKEQCSSCIRVSDSQMNSVTFRKCKPIANIFKIDHNFCFRQFIKAFLWCGPRFGSIDDMKIMKKKKHLKRSECKTEMRHTKKLKMQCCGFGFDRIRNFWPGRIRIPNKEQSAQDSAQRPYPGFLTRGPIHLWLVHTVPTWLVHTRTYFPEIESDAKKVLSQSYLSHIKSIRTVVSGSGQNHSGSITLKRW